MEYAEGTDGKILWCWQCKRRIEKGEKIYSIPHTEGKFVCEKCQLKKE